MSLLNMCKVVCSLVVVGSSFFGVNASAEEVSSSRMPIILHDGDSGYYQPNIGIGFSGVRWSQYYRIRVDTGSSPFVQTKEGGGVLLGEWEPGQETFTLMIYRDICKHGLLNIFSGVTKGFSKVVTGDTRASQSNPDESKFIMLQKVNVEDFNDPVNTKTMLIEMDDTYNGYTYKVTVSVSLINGQWKVTLVVNPK